MNLKSFFIRCIIDIISGYQRISSLFPDTCRFYPSCSEYTKQAILKYGIWKGIFLGTIRIMKCHPYHKGGYDPLK